GQVHHGVGAPSGGPTHFLDLFFDRRGDGAVADVGVDFDEEIAADDHRLGFGMVDVSRDDGAAAGDFGADEFGGDLFGNCGAKAVAGMSESEVVAGAISCSGALWASTFSISTARGRRYRRKCERSATEILADRDEFHFR